MEDDRNRLIKPLKTGWNLILEGISEQNQSSQLLGENHQGLHHGFDELHRNLHQLSQYRHNLNCRLEAIKREIDKIQLRGAKLRKSEQPSIDQAILKLEEEGYRLQLELEGIELELKQIRAMEKQNSESQPDQSA